MKRFLSCGALTLAGLILSGCVWTGADGSQRHLVLGIGIVTSHTTAPAEITQITGLGAFSGPDSSALGLFHAHRTSIDPAAAEGLLLITESTPLRVSTRLTKVTTEAPAYPSTPPPYAPSP